MTKIQQRVWVSGRVQGVAFRASTVAQAREYSGLRGFVRNLADGRVEAVFCGDPGSVRAMVNFCRKGPAGARVIAVDVQDEPVDEDLNPFHVAYA